MDYKAHVLIFKEASPIAFTPFSKVKKIMFFFCRERQALSNENMCTVENGMLRTGDYKKGECHPLNEVLSIV
jgi:hypothetical protein